MRAIHLAVFQHTAEEPMGYFETICRERNIPYTVTRFFDEDEIRIANASHLLVLGGPMSVNDEHEFQFLALEKEIICSWILAGKPVLGICLGAQLIASAFGSSVYPCRGEIGWQKIQSSRQGIELGFPQEFFAFQMHGETFDIPSSGEIVCTGNEVRNQALVLESGLGHQFHPEMTGDLIESWTKDLPGPEKIRIFQDSEPYLSSSHSLCRKFAAIFFKERRYCRPPGKSGSY